MVNEFFERTGVFNSLIVFIVSFFASFILENWTSGTGAYRAQSYELSDGSTRYLFEFLNYSTHPLDGVQIWIPSSLKLNEIETNQNLVLKKPAVTSSKSHLRILEISSLPAEQQTTLSFKSKATSDCCRVVNAGSKGLEMEEVSLDPRGEMLKAAFANAVSAALIFWIYFFFENRKFTELRSRTEKLQEEFKSAQARLVDVSSQAKREIEETRIKLARLRAILLKRVSHYSRELDFWRDAVRQSMFKSPGGCAAAEKLLITISNLLGTYTTKSPNDIELALSFFKDIPNSFEIDKDCDN